MEDSIPASGAGESLRPWSAQLLLSEISGKLTKINESLELILAAVEEKKASTQAQTKFPNVQKLIFDDMKQHGGGTIALPETSVGPGLYRLWDKGLVSQERVRTGAGQQPVSHYKIK